MAACVCVIQYELELHTLRQQLSATQSALDDVTSQLSRERSLSCQQHGDWQQRLHAAEERHRQRETELTADVGRRQHREAELSAELGRAKQREADVTFELTQQRNRVSELSIELAQAERREAETKEELQRLTQMYLSPTPHYLSLSLCSYVDISTAVLQEPQVLTKASFRNTFNMRHATAVLNIS